MGQRTYLAPLQSCNQASTGLALRSGSLHIVRPHMAAPPLDLWPCTERGAKKGLRERNSPKCTLSQNGYGNIIARAMVQSNALQMAVVPGCAGGSCNWVGQRVALDLVQGMVCDAVSLHMRCMPG